MKPLRLYDTYSRKDVHAIFSPYTQFTPQSGTWGLQGIVSVPHRHNDFIFFVSFGSQQGEHVFDEGITTEGVLSWQSQPKQDLHHPQIQQFINHDELINSIYLFLRTNKKFDYTYLGCLKYVSHDTDRECPVYFQWQLLEWSIPADVTRKMKLQLQTGFPITAKNGLEDQTQDELISSNSMAERRELYNTRRRKGVKTRQFRARKFADYAEIDSKNRELGQLGEQFVIEYEKQALLQAGRTDLASKIHHVAILEGDGAGYDILSYFPDGRPKYIEVKTTRGSVDTGLYMSANEIAFARQHSQNYYVYRVYDFDMTNQTGRIKLYQGDPETFFEMTPTHYRLKLRYDP